VTSTTPGLLMVWTNIPKELEYDFNDWYNRVHMRERILGVPGFVRGRWFVAFEGGPRYLAVFQAQGGQTGCPRSAVSCRLYDTLAARR